MLLGRRNLPTTSYDSAPAGKRFPSSRAMTNTVLFLLLRFLLVRHGFYEYNPENYHGPTLYYFSAVIPWISRLLFVGSTIPLT